MLTVTSASTCCFLGGILSTTTTDPENFVKLAVGLTRARVEGGSSSVLVVQLTSPGTSTNTTSL